MKLYNQAKDNIYIFPRNINIINILSKYFQKDINVVYKNVYNTTGTTLSYTLFDIQLPVFNSIVSILKETHVCFFQLKTGSGKTYIVGKVIEYLKKNAVIIVHNKTCGIEWCKIFNIELNDFEGPVICITIGQALKHKDIFGSRSITVIDEVHNFCTEKRYELFWNCNTEYVMACSATVDRNDYRHIYLKYFLGTLYTFETDQYEYNIVAKCIKLNDKYDFHYSPYLHTLHDVYEQLENNTRRNDIIVNIVKSHVNDSIYIFGEHIQHLNHLLKLLEHDTHEKILFIANSEIPVITRPTVMLTTYKKASEGLSLPSMNVLIMVTPRKTHVDQVFGRLMREKTPSTRYLYDLVDTYFYFFVKQFYIRKALYESNKFKITIE
jgi:superfamily II DNA or RNA helicase